MPRRKDHTREEIKALVLTAAEEILNTQGIPALTAREVARRIGYTVGTLYNVFNNFNDLILHINAQTMDNMYTAFTQSFQQNSATPEENVRALTQTYIQFAHTNAPAWQLLFEARTSDQEIPKWYQHKILRLFKFVEQTLLPLLNRSEKQATIAAKTLWAALYGICILSIAGKVQTILGETAQSLATSLVDNYLHGLISRQKP